MPTVVPASLEELSARATGREMRVPSAHPMSARQPTDPIDTGLQFALLITGILVITLIAENFYTFRGISRKVKDNLARDKATAVAWAVFASLMYAGFIYQPQAEDPSIVLTFGAGMQLFSFCLLWTLPRKPLTAVATTEFALLMATSFSLRLSSTCRFQGYLPTDATGDGCYQALEGMCLFLALYGLAGTGISLPQARNCVLTVMGSGLASVVCYGDLNRRLVWDRVYACSLYMEFMSWGFLICRALSAKGHVAAGFLLPAIGSACCRSIFWIVAMEELRPLRPVWHMDSFPAVIVGNHVIQLVALAALWVWFAFYCSASKGSGHEGSEVAVPNTAPLLEMTATMNADGWLGPGVPSVPNLVPAKGSGEEGSEIAVPKTAPLLEMTATLDADGWLGPGVPTADVPTLVLVPA